MFALHSHFQVLFNEKTDPLSLSLVMFCCTLLLSLNAYFSHLFCLCVQSLSCPFVSVELSPLKDIETNFIFRKTFPAKSFLLQRNIFMIILAPEINSYLMCS